MRTCPCCSQNEYTQCCEPYLNDKKYPETPVVLMRSRYTAYTMANIDYIKKTMRGKALFGFQDSVAKRWAKRILWVKLDILQTRFDTPSKGVVEFEATYIEGHLLKSMHEKSVFLYEQGRWFYVDGMHLPSAYDTSKQIISRQQNCPCGSQRKFKNCHGQT